MEILSLLLSSCFHNIALAGLVLYLIDLYLQIELSCFNLGNYSID